MNKFIRMLCLFNLINVSACDDGSVFDMKDGTHRDTWADTDLTLILQKMFDNVHPVCAD